MAEESKIKLISMMAAGCLITLGGLAHIFPSELAGVLSFVVYSGVTVQQVSGAITALLAGYWVKMNYDTYKKLK